MGVSEAQYIATLFLKRNATFESFVFLEKIVDQWSCERTIRNFGKQSFANYSQNHF